MKVPAAMLTGLLAALLLCATAGGAAAQRFPRQLEKVEMFGKGESIRFVFSEPYEGQPIVEHQPGSFSLRFSGTGSTKPVRALRPVEESIYKEIKVVENRFATTVSFLLKDPKQDLRERIAFQADGSVLNVSLDSPGGAPQPSPQGQATQDLLREMESRITGSSQGAAPAGGATAAAGGAVAAAQTGGESGPLALGDVGGSEFFYSLVTMVIALVIIVGVLYGVLFIYNRFLAARLRRFAGTHSIRQVANFHIGPRQRIVVLEINDELIACGVTPSQITYLTHLGGKGALSGPAGGSATGGGLPKPGAGEGGTASGGKGTPPAKAAQGSDDPVHQFAEVLKQKVRSLKRIN